MTDQSNVCYICGEKGLYECTICHQYACSKHWYYSNALQCIKCHDLRDDRILLKAEELIRKHARTLRRKRKQLLIYDAYGVPDSRKWTHEITYFLTNAIIPSIEGEDISDTSMGMMIQYVEKVASQNESSSQPELSSKQAPQIAPTDFEFYCSEMLQQHGWNTKLTKSSGDQGIDIVAERNGLTVVFQCKLHNNPIGNKAVQEIHAGKDFLKADLGIVLSNADFTSAARELAASLNVLLMHYSQLEELDRILFLNTKRKGEGNPAQVASLLDESPSTRLVKREAYEISYFQSALLRLDRKEFTIGCVEFEDLFKEIELTETKMCSSRVLQTAAGAYLACCYATGRRPVFMAILAIGAKNIVVENAIRFAEEFESEPRASIIHYVRNIE
jgi:restriction system protein